MFLGIIMAPLFDCKSPLVTKTKSKQGFYLYKERDISGSLPFAILINLAFQTTFIKEF